MVNSLNFSQSYDRHRLGTVIESEIDTLSRTVKQICESDVESTQTEDDLGDVSRMYLTAPSFQHDTEALNSTIDKLWKQYESIASFREHE